MKKQLKKLTLNKETLRDLTTPNAGEVKGGGAGGSFYCSVTCLKHCRWPTIRGKCH
jgi:hypothetical protein